jgi:hypothetical protein
LFKTTSGKATSGAKPQRRSAGAKHATDSEVAAPAQVPADISATAWVPRSDLDRRQWAATGRRLGTIGRGSQWWIGDWLRYGTAKWGEKYVEAARITGYDVATLRNIAWVASQFEVSLRSDELSWSHHVLLAPLEFDEKRNWLERAARDRLTVSDLRAELRAAKSLPEGAGPSGGSAATGADAVVCPRCGHRADDVVCPTCGHELKLLGEV